MKYKLVKIRNKISFSAFMKNMTISELWYSQILSSYRTLVENNQIPEIKRHKLEVEIANCSSDDNLEGLLIKIIKLNMVNIESNFCNKLQDDETKLKNRVMERLKKNEKEQEIEHVEVVVKGRPVTKTISKTPNKGLINKIKQLTNKNNCYDTFQDTRVKNNRIYPEKSLTSIIKYKMLRTNLEGIYMRIKLLKNLAGFKNISYVEIALSQIRL